MQLDPIKLVLKAPGTILLKLRCDGPLSKVAFKINLSRYNKDHENALLLGKQEALESQLLTITSTPPLPVGPVRYCLPPDPPHFETSFLELHSIL
jgi:hypothetical protein